MDDDPNIVASLSAVLEDAWDVRAAATGREAIKAFGEQSPDVVLLDVQLPDMSGIDVLQQFKMYSEGVGVIMMSGAATFDRVVESMKLGADSFLQKPFDVDTLELTLQSLSRVIATRRALVALKRGEGENLEHLPGISPSMRDLNHLVTQVAGAPSSVLIEGESGTGKGVLAKLIHKRSPRSRAPFVDLNCAGLSRELLESELFGHERGAFTGAMNMKQGLFEIAADGTVFLDEIAEMDITVQARLLKALEDKRFRRLGGLRDLSANFRLIAATNRDLAEDVLTNRFRADLYYRLNVVKIRMPALRERLEDIPILVDVMLGPLAKDIGRAVPSLSSSAMSKLQSYNWPGNVRELRNVLERALLTLSGKEIRSEDLALESAQTGMVTRSGLPSADWEIRPLDEVIVEYIAAALKAADGNVRKASRQLRISPSTLYARLRSESQPPKTEGPPRSN